MFSRRDHFLESSYPRWLFLVLRPLGGNKMRENGKLLYKTRLKRFVMCLSMFYLNCGVNWHSFSGIQPFWMNSIPQRRQKTRQNQENQKMTRCTKASLGCQNDDTGSYFRVSNKISMSRVHILLHKSISILWYSRTRGVFNRDNK